MDALKANPGNTVEPQSLLRLPEVKRRVGLGRTSIYEAIARGDFPRPHKSGERAVAWDSRAVSQWIEARIAASRDRVAA
ncbi:MAG TPA: AlpA family phage regulatory protein [Casimicrobiaceae bacterium]|jgi:prophage regulatory protein